MENKENTWFREIGFVKNPFALDPISKEEAKTKAFVDRTDAREDIKKFVQEKSGATILISEIGHGKSSMTNLSEQYALDAGKYVLRIDPRNKDKLLFFKSLSNEILENIPANKLGDENIQLLKGFLAKDDEYNFQSMIFLFKEIFENNPSILIMDDLDKILNFKRHIKFIKEIIDILPKNLQVITTGDINQIRDSRKIVSILYSIFDFPIVLNEIKSIEQLKEFVYGKMEFYAVDKSKIIKFKDDVFELLLDRTHGNLREAFRYLSELLKSNKYSVEELIRVIIKIDVLRIHNLDEIDREILSIITGDKKDLQDIKNILEKNRIKLTLPTIRSRLDELHQNCWAFKDKFGKKVIYSAPAVVKQMIEIINL